MTIVNIKEFKPASGKIKGTGALYTHEVCKGTIGNDPSQWYCKEINDPALARLEALAQEFFRVIIPHQPETRIAKNFQTGTYYILSKEVNGYSDLPEDQPERFRNGHYRGLGQVMLCSMFLQETDLKNGNIGIDSKNRVIKIDGDNCFSEVHRPGEFKLTTRAIEALPQPLDYYTYNWLDLIRHGKESNSNYIIDEKLSDSTQYRAEINQAMYKICLLPDSFIKAFVDTYMPAGGQRFVDLIISRRNKLRNSALFNESFNDYLATPKAKVDAKNILQQMMQFKFEDQFIVQNLKDLERDFNKELNFPVILSQPVLTACGNLLYKINSYRMVPDDVFMDKAMKFYAHEIKKYSANPQKLYEIKNNLSLAHNHVSGAKGILRKIEALRLGPNDTLMDTTIKTLHAEISRNILEPEKILEMKPRIAEIYHSVCSHEIIAVKNAITTFRNTSGFFSIGKDKKADKIETALYNTPIDQRGTVISSNTTNSVQDAIATHRYPGRRGDVYKTKDGKINHKLAPTLFCQLKGQFPDKHDSQDGAIRGKRSEQTDGSVTRRPI